MSDQVFSSQAFQPAQGAPGLAMRILRTLFAPAARSALIGFAAVAALLGLWEALVVLNDIPTWLVPKPSQFLGRLVTDWQEISGHALATSLTILQGFALGVLISVPLAFAIISVPTFERGLFPVIVFLNIMPKTVIGPILIIWFGISPLVAVLIVFLMCFFPILVDAMHGFKTIDTRLLYISRSMGASRWQGFWRFRLPSAMPEIFSGMKIGIVKAVEGVIIAEFIASDKGLGFMIMRASSYMDISLLFAGLIAAALVALIFNSAMTLIERRAMPWKAGNR